MSTQIRRTALVTAALAMILTGVGCAPYQPPASDNSADPGTYEQSGQRKKSLNY